MIKTKLMKIKKQMRLKIRSLQLVFFWLIVNGYSYIFDIFQIKHGPQEKEGGG